MIVMWVAHNQRRGSHGFTLIELLVAMALMSLLMVGVASALRTMGQTEQRIDVRLTQADELRVASAFVGDVLGRISERKVGGRLSDKDSPYLFDGQAQSVAWLGIMPARHGAGGRFYFRLALEPFDGESALVIRFLPWSEDDQFPDWGQAQSRALVTGVTSFALAYEDLSSEPAQWSAAWTQKDLLPTHVRLNLATHAGEWPLWVVATRHMAPGGQAGDSYSLGPGQ